ncbi:acriflavin resistance protein B [Escherichia coli]|uniref:Acriflavin resistance protein B n=1 Tax=Escherichia coli TaxID=562 RepID=A0A376U3E1_ECOLX|nr:acriflavin resistance protein B [Escherichia coli]
MSYQERLSGNQAPSLYAISLIVVFLCLAALYESWSIPFSVMLVVPLGVIGALLAATFRGLTNDVYFQVGLLTTIGLSAKNAILIVEFAKDLMDKEGKGLIEATLDAVRMRFTSDPDDLAGVYPRRYAAGYQYWCWFRRAERSRYRCNGRDGDRNGTGNLLRSGILCCGSPPL